MNDITFAASRLAAYRASDLERDARQRRAIAAAHRGVRAARRCASTRACGSRAVRFPQPARTPHRARRRLTRLRTPSRSDREGVRASVVGGTMSA